MKDARNSFSLNAFDFSLQKTLESGQLFRYEKVSEGYVVSHRSRAFLISQDGNKLIVHDATPNVTKEWLREFFALDAATPQAVDGFSAQALEYCSGLRVCRQDPWECTIGFICSQNNNIKRISQLMTGLAKSFGKKTRIADYEVYLFPEPNQIRAGEKLRLIKTGYREKYLLAANTLSESWLRSLGSLSYDEARKELLTIYGVGPKVADCILLFAYGHRNAFPVDTWVEQIMREEYGAKTKKAMKIKATKLFGEDAGVMQQYLFHYKRSKR